LVATSELVKLNEAMAVLVPATRRPRLQVVVTVAAKMLKVRAPAVVRKLAMTGSERQATRAREDPVEVIPSNRTRHSTT
jgi:hypothetical protein